MRNLLAVLIVSWAGGGLLTGLEGAPPRSKLSKDDSVSRIVRGIEARYQAAVTLQATFLERYREGQHTVVVEAGRAYFRRPGRMRWEYESPEEKLFVVDGKHVWFYVPADRTVSRARVKESTDWHTPLGLLTGRVRFGRLCGRVELADVRVTAAENVALRCLPKTKDAPFREVLFEVDGNYRLVSLLISEAGGIELEFRFANWRENLPLPAELFSFSPPVGVAIVEDASLAGTPGRP